MVRCRLRPSDAVEAKQMRVPVKAAVDWQEAGFILPDAALLIHDGWTLKEAVNVRYEGMAYEGRPPK